MDFAPRLGRPSTGVVLTGGASGLGRASAEALAAVGRPVAIWDLDPDRCREITEEIGRRYGVKSCGLSVDVRDPSAIEATAVETRRVLPAIVAFASINAMLGNSMNPIYSAAKGGVLALVRSLADRLVRDGIRINSLSPGQIRTPMMQPALDHLGDAAFTRRILLERIGEAAEIGRVARFLLSEEASYITASEFVVDGGNISSQRM